MKKVVLFMGFIIWMVVLNGCGKRDISPESEALTVNEIVLPSWNNLAENISAEQRLKACKITNNGIVCVLTDAQLSENRVWKVMSISAPYTEWAKATISNSLEYQENLYSLRNCCISESGDVYLLFDSAENSMAAVWRDGEISQYFQIDRNPELYSLTWEIDASRKSFFYFNDKCYVYDEKFNLVSVQDDDFNYSDVLQNTDGEGVAFLTNGVNGNIIYSYRGWEELASQKDLATGSYGNGKYIINQDGKVVCFSQEGMFRVKPYEKILDFRTRGISFHSIHDVYAEEKTYLVLVQDEKDYKLLDIKKEMIGNDGRTPITISASSSPFLERCIYEFNRTNQEYYIQLECWDPNVEYLDDFATKQQLKFSAGEGADIIDEACIDIDSYARNGFLLPLSDYIDFNDYHIIQAVLDSGKVNGVSYVAPYSFRMFSLVGLKSTLGELETWNYEQMCRLLEEKHIEAFYPGARPWDFLYCCLAMDEEDKTYIDWNTGTANFRRAEFSSLLELAKKYGDSANDLISENIHDKISDNKYMVVRLYGEDSFDGYKSLCDKLGDDISFIGFPVIEGRGTFLNGIGFAINKSSKNTDGAIAFLKYLMSEDTQRQMIESGTSFPANQVVFEDTLSQLTKEENRLTSIQASRLSDVVQNSKALGKRYTKIINIIYEEAEGYFSGSFNMQDTVEKIQKRVQVFLDEY